MSTQDAPAGGGTPGSAGAGNGFTPEQQKWLQDAVSAAVGARMSRGSLDKKIEEAIGAAFTKQFEGDGFAKIVEKHLDKIAGSVTETPDAGSGAQAQGSGNGSAASAQPGNGQGNGASPEFESLRKQFDELAGKHKALEKSYHAEKKAAADADKQRAAEAKAGRILSHVEEQLLPRVGGNRAQARLLAKEIARERGLVDELEGSQGFAWKTKVDGEDSFVPFDDGFKAWLDKDGKDLLPAQLPRQPAIGYPFGSSGPSGYGDRHNGGTRPNPLYAEIQRGLAQTWGETGTPSLPGTGNNGTGRG